LVGVGAGCAGSSNGTSTNGDGGVRKTQPPRTGGTQTAPECNGLTQRGGCECEGGTTNTNCSALGLRDVALNCDVSTGSPGKIMRTPCQQNEHCVNESTRGGKCVPLNIPGSSPGSGFGPGSGLPGSGSRSGTGLPGSGNCIGNNGIGNNGIGNNGIGNNGIGNNGIGSGPFGGSRGQPGRSSQSPFPNPNGTGCNGSCPSNLGRAGYCDYGNGIQGNGIQGNGIQSAIWCDPELGIQKWDCTHDGMTCFQNGECMRWDAPTVHAEGAYCCNPNTMQSMPPLGQGCNNMTFRGSCSPDRTQSYYCENNRVLAMRCPRGTTCQINGASAGKATCTPGTAGRDTDQCNSIGYQGACSPDKKQLRWCDSDSNGINKTINTEDCASEGPGVSCQTNKCGRDSWCCSAPMPDKSVCMTASKTRCNPTTHLHEYCGINGKDAYQEDCAKAYGDGYTCDSASGQCVARPTAGRGGFSCDGWGSWSADRQHTSWRGQCTPDHRYVQYCDKNGTYQEWDCQDPKWRTQDGQNSECQINPNGLGPCFFNGGQVDGAYCCAHTTGTVQSCEPYRTSCTNNTLTTCDASGNGTTRDCGPNHKCTDQCLNGGGNFVCCALFNVNSGGQSCTDNDNKCNPDGTLNWCDPTTRKLWKNYDCVYDFALVYYNDRTQCKTAAPGTAPCGDLLNADCCSGSSSGGPGQINPPSGGGGKCSGKSTGIYCDPPSSNQTAYACLKGQFDAVDPVTCTGPADDGSYVCSDSLDEYAVQYCPDYSY
jgi:hypothetical protein